MNLEPSNAEELRSLLAAVVDSSDDAIITKNLSGIITSWNKGAERIFGYTAEEVLGHPISVLAPPDRKSEMANILDRIRAGERVDHFETFRRRKDGQIIAISLTVSPVRDADGAIVGASKIARDISERKRAEQALQRANAELRRANRDLEQFAYSASHDLQEPLRIVALYSQLLQKRYSGQLDADAEQYLNHAVQAAQRMQGLVSDLLMYTHAAGVEAEGAESADAEAVLEQALANLESSIRESGASVIHGPLPTVPLREVHLRQLFQNLVGNAIKYRSEQPPCIEIAAVRNGSEWMFSVKDNGIGIAPEYHATIFGLFKRLHGQARYEGTGVGLAICQRIVERYGGQIRVESEPGQGATFLFTLPTSTSALK